MSDRTYDQFGHRALTHFGGAVVIGTVATATQLDATKIQFPFPAKLTAARMIFTTGATAAVASLPVTIQKSVSGTGSYSSIGTFAITGTNATSSTATATLGSGTTVNVAAGDVLAIGVAAGTNANQTANIDIAYEELPN